MRVAAFLVAGALLASGCSLLDDDGGGSGTVDPDAREDSGCPVEPVRIAALVGYDVAVVEETASASSCRYEPAAVGVRAGAHVLVVERRIATDGYAAALAAVEAAAGPTEALPAGTIEGADRGWAARVGRVAQVGAARDRRLIQVTVADPTLDAGAAEAIARTLAAEALEG